jgi:hypothetical protein
MLCKPLDRTSISGTFVSFTFGLASKLTFGHPLNETLEIKEKKMLHKKIKCMLNFTYYN